MKAQEINDKKIWQDFIDTAEPASFLHAWQWGEFEKSFGRKIIRVGVYENGDLVAVALFSKFVAKRGTFLVCPHGPIFSKNIPDIKPALESILNISKEYAKKEGCDFIRISSLALKTEENKKVFSSLGFRNAPIHIYSELVWILDVTLSEDELLKGMKKNTRYSIRKAEKDGVTIRKSTSMDDFEEFWKIYMDTVSRQRFVPYSNKYLKNEFELFFKDNQAVLFFGDYKDTAIATAFVVYANGSGYYHHGASNNTFPGITASELVQWSAIKEAKKRGLKHYNFWGVVEEDDMKHPWFGLSKFKRGFGGYSEEYVHAQDYVLGIKYWFTYLIETVRKIKRRL